MQSFIMNSHEVFIHIHQGCFAGTGAIVRLPQCQWSKPDGYGTISQCITTTKHSKAKTVCIFSWDILLVGGKSYSGDKIPTDDHKYLIMSQVYLFVHIFLMIFWRWRLHSELNLKMQIYFYDFHSINNILRRDCIISYLQIRLLFHYSLSGFECYVHI